MRTARTIGIKADGSEVILADSRQPIHEQSIAFNSYAVEGLPAGVVRVDFQTSDGRARILSAATLVAIKAAEDYVREKVEKRGDWLAKQAAQKAEAEKAAAAVRQAEIDKANQGKAALKRSLFGTKPKSESK